MTAGGEGETAVNIRAVNELSYMGLLLVKMAYTSNFINKNLL